MSDATTVPRKFLLVGSIAAALGIALAGVGRQTLGSLASIIGMALLIGGLHTYGRAGPEH